MNISKFGLFAIVSVMAMVLAGIAVSESDAVGEDLSSTYGEATVIDIAPGYQWRYTTAFPSDIQDYVTVSLEVNDGSIGSVDGKIVTVTIPRTAAVGTVYNIVIKASMTSPVEQTAHQYVQFRVVSGLSVSGTINDIVSGTNIDFTPVGSSSMGEVAWSVKSGTSLPAGLSFSNGKVTGTPTGIGEQTVSLTASCNGQTSDLVIAFTVYSKITGSGSETITSHGNTVSSSGIANASDIGVTWRVTSGTLPDGFSLNPSTGAVSGSSSVVQSSTVTITGSSSNGPAQSVTRTITIQSEPELALTAGDDILTFVGNTAARTSQVSHPETSAIQWSVSGYTGATVSDGLVSITDPRTAGMGQSVTVTAKTAYGQTKTVQVGVSVEDTLSISGDSSVTAIAGQSAQTSAFSVSGGSSNNLVCSTQTAGLNATIVDGKLQVSSQSPVQGAAVTVTVTSAAGQTDSCQVTVDVYSSLTFDSEPTGGAIIYAV